MSMMHNYWWFASFLKYSRNNFISILSDVIHDFICILLRYDMPMAKIWTEVRIVFLFGNSPHVYCTKKTILNSKPFPWIKLNTPYVIETIMTTTLLFVKLDKFQTKPTELFMIQH